MDEETTASYDAAGYGNTVEPGETLGVLVVDMCVAYFDKDSPLDIDQPDVIDANIALVTEARNADVPVFWTRVEYPRGGDGSVWYAKAPVLKCFDVGSPLAEWVPGLSPDEGEDVVTKQHASGFFGTDLADALRSRGVDTVLVTGVSTSGCVRATATDASANGFIPFVVREAVGDRTPAVHESNLFDLHAKYADVVTLDQATHLLTTKKH